MQKLIPELRRLYLLDSQPYRVQDTPATDLTTAVLEQHLRGEQTVALELVDAQGLVRALVIDFHGAAQGKGERDWSLLCELANALQTQLDLPAPAVSITGSGYALWLSLATPVPAAQARHFLEQLRAAYFPDLKNAGFSLRPDADKPTAQLPPCLNRESGRWAAFIHPGMGASFSEEPGLEMQPPFAAQAAFLDGLRSITAEQFAQALEQLRQRHKQAPATKAETPAPFAPLVPSADSNLLLKDATLEDIVRHLHARNIEPTFRHLITR